MKRLKTFILLVVGIGLCCHCGEPVVQVDESNYIPKIVVDGCLHPMKKVENIRITRNYPLNTEVDVTEIALNEALVTVTEESSGSVYELEYNPARIAFEYNGAELVADYGNSYTILVEATVDGRALWTSSTTRIPLSGLEIMEEESMLRPLSYRQRNDNEQLEKFKLRFRRSPDIDSYIVSIVALEATKESFIEDNIFEIKVEDLEENDVFEELQYSIFWTQTQLGGEALATVEIEWFSFWFYGPYRVILYAADKNLSDYLLTHRFIQDIDGNLWEPKFHFEGDGIGVFGSAVTDTVYIEVLRE